MVGAELAQVAAETYFAEGEQAERTVVDRFARYQDAGTPLSGRYL